MSPRVVSLDPKRRH